MSDYDDATLATRARELAASGQYHHWQHISEALQKLGFKGAIRRIAANALLRNDLTALCSVAHSHKSGD